MSLAASPPAHTGLRAVQPLAAGAAALILVGLAGAAWAEAGPRQAALLAIGALAGLALYHGAFGFTAGWRRMILERRSLGVRAQVVMLALSVLLFFPLLAAGATPLGPLSGFVFPVGAALALGAFLFGIGMQLGGGCGSGTLFTVGGGSLRMVVTLAFFIIGSTLATASAGWWLAWPGLAPVSLVETLGAGPAVLLVLLVLALAYAGLSRAEVSRHGSLAPLLPAAPGSLSAVLLRGPWPILLAALALVAVNLLTLLLAGRPWGITSAFALWGSKALEGAGLDVSGWSYWQGDPALRESLMRDVTSVMDFGIMAGALLAAALAGKFAPSARIPARSLLAAVLGGLLLGIGARLGTGCNIGAFFSGIASGSLHGFAWLVFALAGNLIGVRLRPLFRLD